jgi:hypothetical protein
MDLSFGISLAFQWVVPRGDQMTAFRVSTLLTLVLAVMFSSPFASSAGEDKIQRTDSPACDIYVERAAKGLEVDKKIIDECKEDRKRKHDKEDISGVGSCKSHMDRFEKARSEFSASCNKSLRTMKSMGSVLGETKDRSCAGYIERCNECAESETACGSIDEDDDEGDSRSSSATPIGGLAGRSSNHESEAYKRVMEDARQCVLPDGDEFKDANTALKDHRAKRNELEEKQQESQEKFMDMIGKQQNDLKDLELDAEAKRLKAEDAMKKVKEKQEGEEAKIIQGIVQLEMDYNKIDANIRRIERAKIQAEISYVEAQAQLDRNCHASALAQTEQKRQEDLDNYKNSRLTSGGAKQLFQNLGASKRSGYQAFARKKYENCLDSAMYKSAKASSARAKDQAIGSADDEIETLRMDQRQIVESRARLQKDAREQSLKKLEQDMTSVKKMMEHDFKRIDNEYARLTNKSAMDLMNSATKTNKINADLARMGREIEHEEAVVALGRRVKLGKENTIESSQESLETLRTIAQQAAPACCNPNNTNADCKLACSYLVDESGETISNCGENPKGTYTKKARRTKSSGGTTK